MARKTPTPKPSPSPTQPAPAQAGEPRLFLFRGQRVILDSDLARMYGVTTGRFNEAFKRNLERFPQDFAFRLTSDEAVVLISQIAISKIETVTEDFGDVEARGGRRKLPWVFTEHGAVMAANTHSFWVLSPVRGGARNAPPPWPPSCFAGGGKVNGL